jgi:hypothetical protein
METKKHLGYILVKKPGHPRADKHGFVLQHILAIEKHIKRPLTKNEMVMHKDPTRRSDNSIRNLLLFERKVEDTSKPMEKKGQK